MRSSCSAAASPRGGLDVVMIDHTAKGFGPDSIREGRLRSKRT